MKKRAKNMYCCPDCKSRLKRPTSGGLKCSKCDNFYPQKRGFYIFDNSELVNSLNYDLDKVLLDTENHELINKLHRYLIPQIGTIKGKNILSVGCGGGGDVAELNRLGVKAYGMDFLYRTTYWQVKRYSNQVFFVSSINKIPFPLEYFDVIFCMGVIEHVSESLVRKGNYTEAEESRGFFLKTLFKMLKRDGFMIITSPNRNFPIDFQHGSYGFLNFLSRFSIGIHSPSTRFLESYYSLARHFNMIGRYKAEPMPLVNFFGFNVLKLSPRLAIFKNFLMFYIKVLDKMPKHVRKSFLNPYIILKITKLH